MDEFSLRECKMRGLKTWQCPPFQFSVVALILLIVASFVATKYVLTNLMILGILGVFGSLLIASAYIIVRNYHKKQ